MPRAVNDWSDVRRTTIDMSKERWAALGILVDLQAPTGTRAVIGRFLAELVEKHYGAEIDQIVEQRKAMERQIAGK